jgi:nitroreductase
MEIIESIKKRYSTIAFSLRPVEEEKIYRIIEAASWAASARNEQPWRFIIGRKENDNYYRPIYNSLADANKIWAKNAPVLVVTLAKKNYQYQDRPNQFAWHDVGMATAHMLLQTTELGLLSHPMGGFDKDIITAAFNIPEILEPVAVIALGYSGPLDKMPEYLQNREKSTRKRRKFDELVYSGSFEKL